MPELPEVEAMRRLAEEHCVGRRVRRVLAREAGGGPRDGKFDDKVIGEGVGEKSFVNALTNREITAAKRLGKYLWLELGGDGPHLLVHCGMTGSLAMDGIERFSFQSFSIDEAWPPRFTKLQLELSTRRGAAAGPAPTTLAFVDARRFGKLLLRREPAAAPPVSLLAADPLAAPPPPEAFVDGFRSATAPVKSLLLDQGRIVCGIGNWIADEVLHKAKVHPAAPANTLSEKQAVAVHAVMLSIIRTASAVDADAARFPKGWLFHFRWGVGTASGSGVTLPSGEELRFEEVGGRTSAYVPAVQRMGERPEEETQQRRKPRAKRPAAAATPWGASSKKRRAGSAGAEGPVALAATTVPRKRPASATALKRPSAGEAAPRRFAVLLRGRSPAAAALDLDLEA